jgi:methionyl-tRNA synthetase
MDLEEKSLDQVGDRCEECGASLTPAEMQTAMESGGPALCTIHAEETEPGRAFDEAGFVEGE